MKEITDISPREIGAMARELEFAKEMGFPEMSIMPLVADRAIYENLKELGLIDFKSTSNGPLRISVTEKGKKFNVLDEYSTALLDVYHPTENPSNAEKLQSLQIELIQVQLKELPGTREDARHANRIAQRSNIISIIAIIIAFFAIAFSIILKD